MIKQLTAIQQERIPIYVKKWLEVAHRTRTVDQKSAIEAVSFLYEKIMKTTRPKQIVVMSSPMACQRACNAVVNTPYDTNRFRKVFFRKLDRKLNQGMAFDLAVPVYNQFYQHLQYPFSKSLEHQFNSQLRNQLNNRNLFYFDMAWSNSFQSNLSRYGFYDYLLQEVFSNEKMNFSLFDECTAHLQELHQCWFFKEMAFVSDFPAVINIGGPSGGSAEEWPAVVYRDQFTFWSSLQAAGTIQGQPQNLIL